ncbi:hypothetical protein LCGC14_1068000 [marine sediment metagenome]|uniref:Uncharacterized protein n=1 Tax=marine sediment metagenome TaxID=412755 RepID=A0A0F9MJ54_9ZZZZ
MFKVWISREDSEDTCRDFYLILPNRMYDSLHTFMDTIEEESCGRDRKAMQAHEEYKRKRHDQERVSIEG